MPLVALFRGPCHSGVAGDVRRALHALQTTGTLSASLVQDLLLAATELVTNAVNAGARTVEVRLDTASPHVLLDVTDDAAGSPVLGRPTASDTSGRGLCIVEALAEQWGWLATDSGKTVWARFTD